MYVTRDSSSTGSQQLIVWAMESGRAPRPPVLELARIRDLQKVISPTRFFPVWLQKRLISAGLELVLSHIENSCLARDVKNYIYFYYVWHLKQI